MKTCKNRALFLSFITILTLGTMILFPKITRAESPKEIRIGATVSMSGKFSTEIGPFKKLMEAYAATINSRGGIYVKSAGARLPVKFIVYDDKSDGPTSRKFYERLISVDKADILLGPYSSPVTFAASVAAEENKVPFIAICANSHKIYNRGFKWIVCVIDAAPRYTHRYWDMIKAEGWAKTVAFVVEDTLHPKGVYRGAKKLADSAGLKEVTLNVLPANTRDFTAAIVKIQKKSPDIVFVSANVPFSIAFMRQARELGLNPKEFHVIHHGGVFKKGLGAGADDVVGQSYWTHGMNFGNPALFTEVMERSGINLDDFPWAPAYMMAFETATQAIERAGSLDREKLMGTLKRLKVMTVGGVVSFAENGVGTINTYPSQIIGGQYHIVWPTEVATARHRYPGSKK
ncbi:MAG: amino acid ABC transporter substrate-binding protein [Deltaproteobacteria bacterium]|nr:amino acid ABC transporter substrate-binding protein [Deltaproteobacteria bacterium]